jgi:hypothetical protein
MVSTENPRGHAGHKKPQGRHPTSPEGLLVIRKPGHLGQRQRGNRNQGKTNTNKQTKNHPKPTHPTKIKNSDPNI